LVHIRLLAVISYEDNRRAKLLSPFPAQLIITYTVNYINNGVNNKLVIYTEVIHEFFSTQPRLSFGDFAPAPSEAEMSDLKSVGFVWEGGGEKQALVNNLFFPTHPCWLHRRTSNTGEQSPHKEGTGGAAPRYDCREGGWEERA